ASSPTRQPVESQPECALRSTAHTRNGSPAAWTRHRQPVGHGCDVVRTGGIRDSGEVAPERPAPSGALMCEYLRQVEVEVVDDVGVADRLEAQQFFNARPPVPTDDRRVPWCRLSDAGEQFGL